MSLLRNLKNQFLEDTLRLGKIEGGRRRGQRTRWDEQEFEQSLGVGEGLGAWRAAVHGVTKSRTGLSD